MDLEEVNEHNGKKAENRARPWRTRPQIGFSRQSHTRTQSLKWREGNAERSAERRYGAQNLLDDRHRSRHRRRYHPAPMVGSVFHHPDCLFRLVGGLSERLVLEAIRPEAFSLRLRHGERAPASAACSARQCPSPGDAASNLGPIEGERITGRRSRSHHVGNRSFHLVARSRGQAGGPTHSLRHKAGLAVRAGWVCVKAELRNVQRTVPIDREVGDKTQHRSRSIALAAGQDRAPQSARHRLSVL